MSIVVKGVIEELVPIIRGEIRGDGSIVFDESGGLALTVDTGFSGAMALPIWAIEEMDLELVDFGKFRLATGDEIELPVFWGTVQVGERSVETWFVPGDGLMGMELLSGVGTRLTLDFDDSTIELVG